MATEAAKRLIKFGYDLFLWLGNSMIGGRQFLRISGIKPARETKETSRC
jgi:hypothetical protein